MRRALLLYNPAAGRVPIKTFVPSVVGPLREAGWRVELAETLSGSHATSVAREAAAEKFDAVFAVGGDGTVGQVGGGAGFVLELAIEVRVMGLILPQDFDGHVSVEQRVAGTVDERHPARAEAFQQLVATVEDPTLFGLRHRGHYNGD